MAMTMPGVQRVLWPHFANMMLGVWLIAGAFAFGLRSTVLQASDVASGALVIILAIVSLRGGPLSKFWAPWANALVGVWLLFAPLVLWSPTAAGYANDTLVGALVITFAILAPGMPMTPGMSMEPGPDVPQGWSYNPSSWPQRAPIIALALLGFFLSRQMASFQLGYIPAFPDPFFGLGTERVLTSDVSRNFPISDGGLGAVAYMVEALMGFMGDKARWRTMPWMVAFFGILVVPLGFVSITLIMLQPLAVGAWSTPALIAAAAMLTMIALTLDEVIATLQFLVQASRQGQSLWRTFWLGGTLRDLPVSGPVRPDAPSVRAMVWGVTRHRTMLLSAALGGWLMFSYTVLPTPDGLFKVNAFVGALAVVVSMTALAEVGHAIRFANILLGATIVLLPWLFGSGPAAIVNNLVVGVLVIALSFPRGMIHERYGSWERYIR